MLDTKFKAFAEPNRLRIVELLMTEPHSVNEVVEMLDIRQPQASKHLKILNNAGIVVSTSIAQKHVYSLNPEAFTEIDEWMRRFRKLWNRQLDRLGEYLNATGEEK